MVVPFQDSPLHFVAAPGIPDGDLAAGAALPRVAPHRPPGVEESVPHPLGIPSWGEGAGRAEEGAALPEERQPRKWVPQDCTGDPWPAVRPHRCPGCHLAHTAVGGPLNSWVVRAGGMAAWKATVLLVACACTVVLAEASPEGCLGRSLCHGQPC